ncbi:Uncharacterised protein [Vibrio cholerae]|nr:Uncharacterised protein [Vibrio cholerae]CSI56613.1 Uncharacterised protein [Vibrio cholerae]
MLLLHVVHLRLRHHSVWLLYCPLSYWVMNQAMSLVKFSA